MFEAGNSSVVKSRAPRIKKFVEKIPQSVIDNLKQTPVPWGPLGYVTYKRTYSRLREDLGRKEEWVDTVVRCINGLLKYGIVLTEDELSDLAYFWYTLKCMPAGRGLWQLGTKTVDRVGGDSLMNCHFVNISEVEAFTFVFDELMLGGGVGYSILPSTVHKLPKVKRKINVVRKDSFDVDFIIPDNREGWVELLRRVLNAFFVTGRDFSFSTRCIRSKGAPIAGFGGVSSGPEELAKGIGQISTILNDRARKHIRPIDALDILNIIGSVVVSGNVRRSAQIALGHAEDKEFLYAKNWQSGTIPNWRAMSNNTCVCNDMSNLPDDFWGGYLGTGEPYGLFNLDLARKYGRLIDGEDYRPDNDVDGVNPCAEQTLEDGECCCLVEQCLPMYKDVGEFVRGASLIYKVAKTMISLPFSWAKAQAVVEKNRRIGIGITGIAQSNFNEDDFNTVYKSLEEMDDKYSKLIGVNPSIKLTTTKPSGTVSLLPGVTPGVHPAYAQHYIRRIRFAADDKLVNELRKRNYHVENVLGFDGRPDPNTVVASFPVKTPAGALLAKDTTAIKQLELQRKVQTYWSDNAVSVTVYYRKEELPEIKEYLKSNYKDGIKSVSFLLHSEHGFVQAPYQEITEQQYKEMAKGLVPITSIDENEETDIIDGLECQGACPTR